MSAALHFNLIETDHWPVLRQKIAAERERRMADLLHVATLDGMRQQQGFIEALDWIAAQAEPAPPVPQKEIYDE